MSSALVCGRCGALGPGLLPLPRAHASTQTDSADCSNGLILALQQELALAHSQLQQALDTRRQTVTAATQTGSLNTACRGPVGLPAPPHLLGQGPDAAAPPWDLPMYLQGPQAAPFPLPIAESTSVATSLHLPDPGLRAEQESADSDSRDDGEVCRHSDSDSPNHWGAPVQMPTDNRCGRNPQPDLPSSPPSPSAPQQDWGPYSEQLQPEPDIETWRIRAPPNATDTVASDGEDRPSERQETPAPSTSSRPKKRTTPGTKGRARRKPGRRIHPCPDCGKTFPSQKDVRRHRFSHTGEKPHACTWCGKAFALASNLRSHERAVHAGERPHACTHCNKAFSASKDLRLHILTHTGERPHACTRCNQRFTQLGNLRTHERVVHLKERPHVCDTCGRGFAKLASFRAHVRSHTGERPHVCEECGRAFGRSELLSLHRRTHTGERPYPCTECGRAFSQLATLTQHKRTHTGERPFKCVSCGSAFARKSSLTQHMRTHTGERPFSCEHCGRAFSRSSRLTEHRRTAHAPPLPTPPPPM